MTSNKILITGGTGFLGSHLIQRLSQQGYELTVLSRNADKVTQKFGHLVSPATRIADLPDAGTFKAVINLAGAGIFDRYWTNARKQILRESRIQLTQNLVKWINSSKAPCEVLISGSAIGIYGDQGDTILEESSHSLADFSSQLCEDWEKAALEATAATRVCLIRTGLVLGNNGGLLQRMRLPFQLGLGGTIGNGRQWMSWIHIEDWLSIVDYLINNPKLKGPFNATAPNPVTNQTFSTCLAGTLKRPMLLPLPASPMKLLLGEMASLVLGSQRVLPQRLLAEGFKFEYPELEAAMHKLLKP